MGGAAVTLAPRRRCDRSCPRCSDAARRLCCGARAGMPGGHPRVSRPGICALAGVTPRRDDGCPTRPWAQKSRPGRPKKGGIRRSSVNRRNFGGSPRRVRSHARRLWTSVPTDFRTAVEPPRLRGWGGARGGRIHGPFGQIDPVRGDRHHCDRCPYRHNRLARNSRIWRRWADSRRPAQSSGGAARARKGERTDRHFDPPRSTRSGRLDLPEDPLQAVRRQGGLAQRG